MCCPNKLKVKRDGVINLQNYILNLFSTKKILIQMLQQNIMLLFRFTCSIIVVFVCTVVIVKRCRLSKTSYNTGNIDLDS